jgi:hypothetical protein
MARPKVYTSRAWLRRKFLVERLTETEIAELAGTSQVTINKWLRFHGLRK